MKEERTIADFGRVPAGRLWWSSIFGGIFFAYGVMLILSVFGVAVAAAASGAEGVTAGAKAWSGIWSLVTLFVGFLAGGWLAGRTAGSITKNEGRLHGLVVWSLGSAALFYFLVSSGARIAGIGVQTGTTQSLTMATPGLLENVTATAATWMLIAAICGLIGGIVGGNAGTRTYAEAEAAPPTRRAA
jgi:hypothetical protein